MKSRRTQATEKRKAVIGSKRLEAGEPERPRFSEVGKQRKGLSESEPLKPQVSVAELLQEKHLAK